MLTARACAADWPTSQGLTFEDGGVDPRRPDHRREVDQRSRLKIRFDLLSSYCVFPDGSNPHCNAALLPALNRQTNEEYVPMLPWIMKTVRGRTEKRRAALLESGQASCGSARPFLEELDGLPDSIMNDEEFTYSVGDGIFLGQLETGTCRPQGLAFCGTISEAIGEVAEGTEVGKDDVVQQLLDAIVKEWIGRTLFPEYPPESQQEIAQKRGPTVMMSRMCPKKSLETGSVMQQREKQEFLESLELDGFAPTVRRNDHLHG